MLTVTVGLDRKEVLREMDSSDIEAALKNYELSQRAGWEQTRMVAYITAAPHMKKQTSITSFMPLPWDKNTKAHKLIAPPTREDFERLKQRFKLR